MESGALEFLKRLLHTPSPSGFEERIQQVVREYVSDFAESLQTDVHGNVIAAVNPDAPVRVMLDGHCDQIGLIVKHIDSDGFLSVQAIGGWDIQMLIGQRVSVWTDRGEVPGVIARKAIHLLTEEERKQVPKMHELWVDVGVRNKEEAQQAVQIGDAVTLALGYHELRNDLAISPAMDDKTGVWVVVEALRRARAKGVSAGVFVVSAVQEEIGLRGTQTAAYTVDPHVGVAVDVTHATDCPTIDKRQVGEVRLGAGPVIFRGPNINPHVASLLMQAAGESEIPYQLSSAGRALPNDANAIQVTRGGVAAGLVALPNRYMHSPVEMISLHDIDHAADLLAEFVCRITPETSLIP